MRRWSMLSILVLFLIGCNSNSANPPNTSPSVSAATSNANQAQTRSIAANSDPRKIALAITDVPSEFKIEQQQTGEVDNAAAAAERPDPKEHLRLLNQWGRDRGYHTFYSKDPSGLQKGGIYIIQSFVSTYKTIDGARQYFDYASANTPPQLKKMGIPAIGEQASAWKMQQPGSTPSVTGFVLNFQKGNVVATSIVIGFGDESFLKDAIALAKVMEGRIDSGVLN